MVFKDEGYFVFASKVAKIYRQMCFEAVKEYRFTPCEIVVLMFLFNHPGLDTAKDISRQQNISKALVAKSVESLCKKGFLQAEKDGRDRRLVHLRLCDASADITCRLQRCKEAFLRQLQEGIPEGRIACFRQVLEKMDENLNAMLKTEKP